MSRTPIMKELQNTRLASGHGGWVYCGGCGETIGYLCYVTYDDVQFTYQCNCGNCGSMHLAFVPQGTGTGPAQQNALITIKNRLCCPVENAPLFTMLAKKLTSYTYDVVCAACKTHYKGGLIR